MPRGREADPPRGREAAPQDERRRIDSGGAEDERRRIHFAAAEDEARAWACLFTNLLVLPGLGSIIAGRRSGWPQAAIALAGFVLTTVWLVWFLAAWSRGGEFPLDPGPYLPVGALGVLLFTVSWVWSLLTGLLIVRDARGR
jgi:hypothetical protein